MFVKMVDFDITKDTWFVSMPDAIDLLFVHDADEFDPLLDQIHVPSTSFLTGNHRIVHLHCIRLIFRNLEMKNN